MIARGRKEKGETEAAPAAEASGAAEDPAIPVCPPTPTPSAMLAASVTTPIGGVSMRIKSKLSFAWTRSSCIRSSESNSEGFGGNGPPLMMKTLSTSVFCITSPIGA